MMKALSALVFGTLLFAAQAQAHAQAAPENPTVSKKSVSYSCQQGKRVRVVYGFNQQGLPTYAEARVDGKVRHMPIDLNRSNNVETMFGEDNSFRLGTTYMDSKNYARQRITVTAPDDSLEFKDCAPRRRR